MKTDDQKLKEISDILDVNSMAEESLCPETMRKWLDVVNELEFVRVLK